MLQQEVDESDSFDVVIDVTDSSMWSSSELSISSSMPVILPARSGYIREMRGKRRSPNICFCSWGGAAANMEASFFAIFSVVVLLINNDNTCKISAARSRRGTE
ncbi:hypothetical protein MAR_030900 [Mya arenaria]|uniref:Uncharacterized protein n=1 Tax=Mya arenaria TaxID=6604 RepID=A0ABY7F5J6_MYAAR|nr:hypothetical protein MAR_030900 [Mya arenaria]